MASLLRYAEGRWRGVVEVRTSMADLIFTRLGDRFPWETSVRAGVRPGGFEFKVTRGPEEVVSTTLASVAEAPRVLDEQIRQLVTPS
jgi:hypothetical protein